MMYTIETYLSVTPKVEYISAFDPKTSTGWDGIKALWYEGAFYQNKPTKVFAYIGYPEMNGQKKVPAVVLVHGGGGHAYAQWIKLWNERGYAAIAMDTEGSFPAKAWKGLTGTEREEAEYVKELYDELSDETYTVGPSNIGMETSSLPLDEQWMYHAVIDTILAHNILREDARIDKNRIGITGISWGSVVTTLAIGYDTRYAFAIPIYGSAYLEYADTGIGRSFRTECAKKLWSATDRLSNVKFPVLWLCCLYDDCFSSESNSKSYLDLKDRGSYLSIQENLHHSHIDAWAAQEPYRFADCVLAQKEAFIKMMDDLPHAQQQRITVRIPKDMKEVSARLVYFTENFQFDEKSHPLNRCKSAPLTIEGNAVSVCVPQEAYCYYIEFKGNVNGQMYLSTTEWIMKGETLK